MLVRKNCMAYFKRVQAEFTDPQTSELDITGMAESAQDFFHVASDNGDSEIESLIFDWAAEFAEGVDA